jgi:hypothetical protein
MKSLVKWLKWFSKYISLGVVIGIPVLAIWGALFPWPPAEQGFSGLSKSAHIFVGMKVNYVPLSTRVARTESRSYLIVSASLGWPNVVTVSQTDAEVPKVSNPSVIRFLILLGSYAFAACIVWRNWFRRAAVPARVA